MNTSIAVINLLCDHGDQRVYGSCFRSILSYGNVANTTLIKAGTDDLKNRLDSVDKKILEKQTKECTEMYFGVIMYGVYK